MIARRTVLARDSLAFLPPAGRGSLAADLLTPFFGEGAGVIRG